jgi:hypothetical protein
MFDLALLTLVESYVAFSYTPFMRHIQASS